MLARALLLGLMSLHGADAVPFESSESIDSLGLIPQGETGRIHLIARQAGPGLDCRLSASSYAWQNCSEFVQQYHLTVNMFYRLNPAVLEDCAAFVPGNQYCIGSLTSKLPTTDGTCSRGGNTTCVGSRFGDCCGKNGRCGSTDDYCAIGNCQAGNCPGNGYSFDGLCGPNHSNLICGGPYGKCCSVNGVCGSRNAECGVGNCLYGECDSSVVSSTTTTTSSRPSPTPGTPSPDGTCGKLAGYSCLGTQWNWGNCCGEAGYCGYSEFECSPDYHCQSEYGLCDVISTIKSTSTGATVTRTGTGTVTRPTAAITTSAAPTSTSAIASSTGQPPSPGGPVFYPGNSIWSLVGCVGEPSSGRALPTRWADDAMTIESCLARAAAYQYAGVEYGRECWYGHTLNPASTEQPLGECNKLCAGNSLQYCGAGKRLILYRRL